MDGFGTSTELMTTASHDVASAQQQVESELTRLRSNLESLRGAWTGEAYTTFAALMVRWDTNARSLTEALASIGSAIQSSGLAYQAQEDEQSGSISTISLALD